MHVDLSLRIRDLVAAVRAAYATSVTGLSAADRDALARAALGELATLTAPSASEARRAFRPIVIAEDARPSALGSGVCSASDRARDVTTPVVSAETEQRVAGVLAEVQQPVETIDAMYRRKELALVALFGALAPIEAHALHRRLAIPAAGDVLAMQFARLVHDRRTRLLAFLAGARRREVLRSA